MDPISTSREKHPPIENLLCKEDVLLWNHYIKSVLFKEIKQ